MAEVAKIVGAYEPERHEISIPVEQIKEIAERASEQADSALEEMLGINRQPEGAAWRN